YHTNKIKNRKKRIGFNLAPNYFMGMAQNMSIIAESIDYLVEHYQDQPDLEFLSRRAGYEPTYFQKLFKEKVGISPKRLQQYMNMRQAKDLLGAGYSVLDTAFETGLSSTSRLHDLFVTCEGMTPGNIQTRGENLTITYGIYPSVLGNIIVAKTHKGICWLGFMMEESAQHCIARMQSHWPKAQFRRDDKAIEKEGRHLLDIWSGQSSGEQKIKLDLYGTNFQLQVWQALLRIPSGKTLTYQNIAKQLNRPKASRAIGNAVGANPVSVLIPCHRVIRASGIIDNYGWGSPRKKMLLALESSALG
ncbi:MAG: bifunctional transcriptional activator/DNA repair enzyme AdaA, partial [Alphaproteobacteria bacterium]